jgi:hypothetical protein
MVWLERRCYSFILSLTPHETLCVRFCDNIDIVKIKVRNNLFSLGITYNYESQYITNCTQKTIVRVIFLWRKSWLKLGRPGSGSENSRKAGPESLPSGHKGRPRRFSGYSQGGYSLQPCFPPHIGDVGFWAGLQRLLR